MSMDQESLSSSLSSPASRHPVRSLRDELTREFVLAFGAAGFDAESSQELGLVIVADRPDLAQFQCNGALTGAKRLKKNPRELAQKIAETVSRSFESKWGEGRVQVSLAGPGFINLICDDSLLSKTLEGSRLSPQCGVLPAAVKRKIVIDYGAPNVAKSMHVGHLRSTIIGDSIARILRFLGHEVIGDNHIGDWGTPMGMVLMQLKSECPELPYFDPNVTDGYPQVSPVTMEDLERLYPLGSKRFKDDPDFQQDVLRATDELQKGRPGYRALWKHFVDTTYREMNREYQSLGIRFDVWLGESFYDPKMRPLVERLKSEGKAVLSEGAWVVPLTETAEMPPLILVKSGGGYLYSTSDLATVEYRVSELKADLCLYVVDNRQSLHFKQVFLAAKKVGLAGDHCQLLHLGFGTMNGTDGKPFKTREGGVIKLRDLIEMVVNEAKKRLKEMGIIEQMSPAEVDQIAHQVGIATLKYADLKNNRTSDYVFDLERFGQFEGNTGPYLQYAAVRIQSILRKAEAQGLKPGALLPPRSGATGSPERQLVLELLKFPDVVDRAAEGFEPHVICDYGFNLSQAFNHFYKECHILREEDPARQASWLGLAALTHRQLVLALGLVGIEVPARM